MIYFPCCKINLGLNITEKRSDGFHNIETVFYPIPLKDALEIRPRPDFKETKITVVGLPIDTQSNDDNLCIKAYNLIKKDFPDIPNVEMYLSKAIPTGAGLGGGSSDATFTLKLLNFLFTLNLSTEALENYARQLGSDCALFVKSTPIYAEGKGDIFTPISIDLSGKTILLIKPDIFISTAEAYSNVKPKKSDYNLFDTIQKTPMSEWKNIIRNDFEERIFPKHDIFQRIKDKLYDMGAEYASLSGSGATMYGIFDRTLSNDEIKGLDYPFVKSLQL